MKKFMTILKFELGNYIQNKTYMVSTLLIVLIIGIVMFLPRFIDMSDMLGTGSKTEETVTEEKKESKEKSDEEKDTYLLFDKAGVFTELTALEAAFPDAIWEIADSEEDIKKQVTDQKAEAGYVVNSLTDYDYYVYNKGMMDSASISFENILKMYNRVKYCEEHNLDFKEIEGLYNLSIKSNENVLGKNMENSYWYCYGLVIFIFMIIIFYGVMIATAVTAEKSNRSIEVLVTTAKPTYLLFGKVISGAIASFLQVGVLLLTAIGGYKLNQEAWGNKLDVVLDIPPHVLAVFAMFAVGGFLFYAFVYGAVGALVSKTEDINKTAGSIQMIIMIVYFAVLFQMYNIDGIVMKVASFLPISSYSAMYIRVAMGNVDLWEIIVSFAILIASIIGVGFIGAKIYRMGTLRYGNPIKISTALKLIRQKSE